nr:GGDEF domain-containing protein [Sedimentibacter sp.]
MIVGSIGSDVIGIAALFFTIKLARRNAVVDVYKTKIYILASTITIILLYLEIVDIWGQSLQNAEHIWFYNLENVIGFFLTPVVPFILLFLYNNEINNKIHYYIPLILNSAISIASYKTGWIFYFDQAAVYHRGIMFFVPIAAGFFYYTLLMISIMRNDSKYEKDDLIFLKYVFLMPIMGVSLQLYFVEFHIVWPSVALALLLYYIFLRELQFKYDVISGIMNRKAFESEMELYNSGDNVIALVVLDLNDLKKINDSKGHHAGDKAILISATVLQESFEKIGRVYRIGGDEFCALCTGASEKDIVKALEKLENLLLEVNKIHEMKIELAYGYAFYCNEEDKSIYETFKYADRRMYTHKAKLKGLYGRRADDTEPSLSICD